MAQSTASSAEAEIQEVVAKYEKGWNTHDVSTWASFLTDDVWYSQAWDYYGRGKGKENAIGLFKSNFADSDLTIRVLKVKVMPDGTATAALSVTISYLPKTDGKYRIVFEKEPSIGRWRKDGTNWRMFFFTSDKGWALDLLKKDGME
jgi:uncharacterized protein (TIGR02246 family)